MWHKTLLLGSESANSVQKVVNIMQMNQKLIWEILSLIVYEHFNFFPIAVIPQKRSSVYPT
jgi:hypothetical protein